MQQPTPPHGSTHNSAAARCCCARRPPAPACPPARRSLRLPQNISLPLTGDDAAIKKYAADVEALKAKIGMPDVEEVRRLQLSR